MTVAVSTASAIQQLQSRSRADLRLPDRDRLRLDRADHDRQPARPARVRQHLRDPDLRLRRPGPGDRGDRRLADRRRAPPHRSRPSRTRWSRAPRRSTLFLLLKAFAGGSVALTGVEAIANGVPAFKPPESKNAANTMTAMAVLLGIIFIGVTIVAHAFAIVPSVDNSRRPDGHRPRRRHGLRGGQPAVRPLPDRARRSSCSSPRTPASTPSRGWRRSWPRTATCPASSASGATGSPTAGASSCWPASHSVSSSSSTAIRTPSSRSTRSVSSSASPCRRAGWSGTGSRTACRAGGGGPS